MEVRLIVIQEFLAALGIKDNFSGPLNSLLQKGEKGLGNFKSATIKQFALAGFAVAGFIAAGVTGMYKFTQSLLKNEDDIKKLSKEMGISRDQAFATKSALDVMGKSLKEIKADPELLKQFKALKKTALEIRPPDMSEGLGQVRELNKVFTAIKQTASIGIQWIGYYFLKHIKQPLESFKNSMKGFNERLIKAMPKVTEGIAKIMSWVIKLGSRVIGGAKKIWDAVVKLMDMVPDKLKTIGIALLALNKIMKMGPFGIFVTLISLALLLLDDFFTFMEGGESLFGSFWKKLIDNNAIKKFKESFESIKTAFSKVVETLNTLFEGLFEQDASSGIEDFLVWLLGTAIPGLINGIGKVIGVVAEALTWFLKIPGVTDELKKLLIPIGAIIVAMKAWAAIQAIIAITNPVILIILGIVALITIIYLLIKHWDKVVEFLKKSWDRIKETFSGIGDWFKNKFNEAKESAINAFKNIGARFGEKVSEIKSFFASIPEWFGAKFSAALEIIKNVFSPITDWFNSKIEFIKFLFDVLPKIANAAMSLVVKVIKDIFGPIVDWFKEKIDKIKNFFGGIANGIKGIFGGGDGPPPNPTPSPGATPSAGHAEGGIFDKEHVARFAEGNQPEAVIPLNKPNKAKEILAGIGKYLGKGNGQGEGQDISQLAKGIANLTSKLLVGIENMNRNMTQVKSVSTSPNNSTSNTSKKIDVSTNINVYDKSGNPQSTANAVSKNEKDVIRNITAMAI